MAVLLNVAVEGLSARVWFDNEDEGLEGEERCTLGTGIIDRLGGRGGCANPEEVVLMPDMENVGEKARCR